MTVDQLADELFDVLLDANPIEASLLGIRDREDRLPDYTEAGQQNTASRVRDVADRARSLSPYTTPFRSRVTRAVVLQQAETALDDIHCRGVEYTITDTFFAPAPGLLADLGMVGITEQAHADGYLARLAGLPAVFEAIAQRHRAGIAAGRVPVRRLVQATVEHFDRYLSDPDNDSLRRPAPADGSGVDLAAFEAERDRLLHQVVYPALRRYRDVLATEVVPHGRPDDRAGLRWLPDGDDYYARLVKLHTTTERTPEQLHQTGLDVIAALTDEYADVGQRVFGTRDVATI